jgi:hypothetical protein
LFTRSSVLGRVGGTDYNTLSDWRVALGQDGSSGFSTPNFVNANGTTSLMNLRPQSPTAVEKSGAPISSVLTDIDGQLRSSLSQVDIGAYAGNFTILDSVPPVITHTPLGNTSSTGNRTVTATFADGTGMATSGTLPILYYKKNYFGSYVQSQGTFASGTNGNGLWSFTIDANMLGSLSTVDSVYYYFAFQDSSAAHNLTSFPTGAVGTDVFNMSEPFQKLSYKINPGAGGVYEVGSTLVPSPTAFNSLTNVGGLFEMLNASTVTSDITIKIVDSLKTETGANALNKLSEDGIGNYKINIVPDTTDGIVKAISGSSNAVIRLNGARNVIIDGAAGGNTKYLAIRNESGAAPVIVFINDAVRDTIKNCVIEGATVSATSGVILFSTGIKNGNDSIVIINNIIRDLSNIPSFRQTLFTHKVLQEQPIHLTRLKIMNCLILIVMEFT